MTESIPKLSKHQVNMAGDLLRQPDIRLTPVVNEALNVLGAWRASHAYPLQVIYMHLRERAKRVDPKPLVYQRLKRVPSIIVKLNRNANMKLSTMQDIGGCRAVVADVHAVRKLAHKCDAEIRNDYISSPKPDGYRSIHLVERYKPSLEKYGAHAGLKIEIQLRTHLQHAWATAVETVDSLLKQNLKTGGGEEEWRRFFALASSVIALQEGCMIVPETSAKKDVLIKEIRRVAQKLDVFNCLDGLTTSVENLSKMPRGTGYVAYVLVLDLDKKTISTTGFRESDREDVASFYLEKEKEYFENSSIQIVQASVSQIRELKRAFPNYYLNTRAFLQALKEAF